MEIFGFTFGRTKDMRPIRTTPSWWATVREPFAGAWQKNIECETPKNILAFSAVYACVSLISSDIAKLRIKLVERQGKIWVETDSAAFSPVLRKPNSYQTRIQFLAQWIQSKLLYGNTYVLKDRDNRGVVTALYVLDPKLVIPLVADDGSVYYEIKQDNLSGVKDPITVPASDIIHDRMMALWHPLVGVSPIYAAGSSATQGLRIQNNSARFFENMSRPSLHLGAPGKLSDEQHARIKNYVESVSSGSNLGKVLLTSDGMTVTPFTIPASDAQLIEQLRWTVEDVARCFHVPLHKLGMGQPTLNNIGALNQDYYTQTLQALIEDVELLLDEGLKLPAGLGTELDVDALLRMDPLSRADKNEKAIRAGYLAPNEARVSENLPDAEGGETPYLQQQNYALSALAKRDAKEDPFATTPAPTPPAAPEPEPADDTDEEMRAFVIEQIAQVRADIKSLNPEIDYARIAEMVKPEQVDEAKVFADALIAKFSAASNNCIYGLDLSGSVPTIVGEAGPELHV